MAIQTIDYTKDFRRGKTFGTTGVIGNCKFCGRKGKITGTGDTLLVIHKTGEEKDFCRAEQKQGVAV